MIITENDIASALNGHFYSLSYNPLTGEARLVDFGADMPSSRAVSVATANDEQKARFAAVRQRLAPAVLDLKADGMIDTDIAGALGVSRNLVRRILAEAGLPTGRKT